MPSLKPLPHSKAASSGREAVICPGFSEKFSGRPRPDPPQRFARITAATCGSASIASIARISVSPVWCRLTPGMAHNFANSRGWVV